MSVFFNEWDGRTAAWLSRLSEEGHIPAGTVDTRSITDLTKKDVFEYEQCHFFAGIGGWPLALRCAGLEGVPGIWTGSPPCQPFSTAGKQKCQADERHLAPVWLELIRECRPSIVFGEQVAAAIRTGWLDDLFDELESEEYTCGAAVLPACSIGAPHLRNRLFFGAVRMADPNSERPQRQRPNGDSPRWEKQTVRSSGLCGGAGSIETNRIFHWNHPPPNWLGCQDGRFRPVESGSFPLADGIPARVGRLRGYGNAIVPQVAAVFVTSFIEAAKELSL